MIEETGKVCLHVVRQLLNFFKIPYIWYVRFCDWLVYPTYDNGFNQKIAYTGKEAWINRILAIVAVLFILAIMIVIIVEVIKRYKRMWDEISQMFLVGSFKKTYGVSPLKYRKK